MTFRKLKLEISDLEAEIKRFQKKCEHLESMIQANDNTPRRTELRKRLIHESPAPEMPNTPVAEETLKVVLVIYYYKNVLTKMLGYRIFIDQSFKFQL